MNSFSEKSLLVGLIKRGGQPELDAALSLGLINDAEARELRERFLAYEPCVGCSKPSTKRDVPLCDACSDAATEDGRWFDEPAAESAPAAGGES